MGKDIVGYRYKEYDVGGGRSRILGNSIPKYCSYCGSPLNIIAILSGRFDRDTGKAIEIACFDCPKYGEVERFGQVGKGGYITLPIHERYYLDDSTHIDRIKAHQGWKEYLSKDA